MQSIKKAVLKSHFIKASKQFSVWGKVPQAPPDAILGINEAFKKDTNPQKVLLGVGAYRDDAGKSWVLDSVKRAEAIIHQQNMDHEYLPAEGNNKFIQLASTLAYGEDSSAIKEGRVAGIQSLSGTGACRIGWEFALKYLPGSKLYISKPTWPNHNAIATEIGLPWENYRYYKPETKGLDFEGMLEDIHNAPNGSMVLLHVCSHNPTGVDPSEDQWNKIRDVMVEKQHFAFFDSAYQGFTSGDLIKDAYSLRLFERDGRIPLMLGQSFAKNFGLYGERVGALTTICQSKEEANRVQSQLKTLSRRAYSNPPLHGARIVEIVLSDPELYQLWTEEIKVMANRIADMRREFVKNMKKLNSPHNWDHITNQIGMFAYTGLPADAVKEIIREHHVYLSADARISIAGMNSSNIEYVAWAFNEVSKNIQM